MNSNASPISYGSNGAAPPVIPVKSSSLSVIFEWIALLPLVVYLASSHISYDLVGRTALAGYIPIGVFPRLGVLGSIADFLQEGADFLDRASSVSERHRTVWDVNWGSIFPCANGSAAGILSAYAIRHVVPEQISENDDVRSDLRDGRASTSPSQANVSRKPAYYREQILHLIDCTGPEVRHPRASIRQGSTDIPFTIEILVLIALLGLCTITALFGLYGTTAAILLTVFFRIARQLILVERPQGYLQNNEGDAPGAMLVALHENASTWYLFRNSRAVIDTLLNKTMIQSITSPLGIWLAYALRALELLQIIIMTYVAGQKGWDGVALLCLVFTAWAFDSFVYSDQRIAALWLRNEGVVMQSRSFKFGRRSPMIGAIHAVNPGAVRTWMDSILVPSARRDVWLAKLSGIDTAEMLEQLSLHDRRWVEVNTKQAEEAVKAINHPKPSAKSA